MQKTTLYTMLLSAALLVPAAPIHAQSGQLKGLEAYIDQAIKAWEVPGLAISIVRNDSVIHASGYGVRELGKPARVTPQTIFAIGSASKAFTAAVLATQVDDGKIKWDDPASKYLPGLEMNDPYVSSQLTIRDLLSHRSGLARGDLLWYASEYDRDEVVRRVRYLEPTWSFRSNFGYQNIMYVAAGQLAARIGGKSWDDLVHEKLFAPLNMHHSNTTVTRLGALSDVAAPHTRFDDKLTVVPYRNIDNAGPAGSINSNVIDMAQWVRMHLAKGSIGGKQVLKPESVREMQLPNIVIRSDARTDSLLPETHLRAYGLGWFLEDYRGRKIVHHGGNIDGMSALVWMVPEENIGLVILTNLNGTSLPTALAHRVTDLLLGEAKRDWSAEYLAFTKEGQRRAAAAGGAAERARVANTKPSLALDKYTGTFDNEMYGTLVVELKDGKLMIRGDALHTGELEHWHFDIFRAAWSDRGLGRPFATFILDPQARAMTLRIDGLGDYTRRPAAAR